MTGGHDELLEVAEAMAMLRIRDRHDIYKLIESGQLIAFQRKPKGKWLISRNSVEALMQPPSTPE